MQSVGTGVMFLHSPSIHVCFVGQLARDFSDEAFRKAISAVEQRHPVLRCVVAQDAEGQYDFKDGGGVSVAFPQNSTWQNWYAGADAQPFDLACGPLLKSPCCGKARALTWCF